MVQTNEWYQKEIQSLRAKREELEKDKTPRRYINELSETELQNYTEYLRDNNKILQESVDCATEEGIQETIWKRLYLETKATVEMLEYKIKINMV